MASDLNNPPAPRDADYYQLDRRLTVLETRFDTIVPTLATKADLSDLKAELKAHIFGVKADLAKWLATLAITMVLGFAGMLVTMFNLLRH
jgi:hypothetical protein